jgi:N-acyl homoserine lactone hydrolase
MLRHTRVAILFGMFALMLMLQGARDANARSKLPDATNAGVAERLYMLDCGRSLANDESVWTPGDNVGRNIEFSSTCWLIKHGSEWLYMDAPTCPGFRLMMACRIRLQPYIRTFAAARAAVPDGFG